jgi:hypothetical protein
MPIGVRGFAGAVATWVVAGYVGTKAMEPVSMFLYRHEPAQARAIEDAARPGPPSRAAGEKITSALGLNLTDEVLDKVALGFHYGLALSWAPLYGILRRRVGLAAPLAALLTGLTMSVLADELMTPLLGFSAPNRAYPLATHLRGVVAHLVFGATVGAVSEVPWATTGGGRAGGTPRMAGPGR